MQSKKNNFATVLKKLKRYYKKPNALALTVKNKYKLLISTIISQRNTDTNTQRVTRALFKKFKSIDKIANAHLSVLKKVLRPSGFYNNKAKNIRKTSRILIKKYNKKVPDTMNELVSLPGVGRKTAGIVLNYGFQKPEGIPVDTHVHRISNRLGWVKTRTPNQTEKRLMAKIPKKYWLDINWLFVTHGKETCKAIKPKCYICPIRDYCNYYKEVYRNK